MSSEAFLQELGFAVFLKECFRKDALCCWVCKPITIPPITVLLEHLQHNVAHRSAQRIASYCYRCACAVLWNDED
jgi:hypothetical protein